jgi:hypothetical protein
MAQQQTPKLELGVAKPCQSGAKMRQIRAVMREHAVGDLDDAGERSMQRPVIALEQLEACGKPRLDPAEYRKTMQVLDPVMLLELPEEDLQVAAEPAPELKGLRRLCERSLATGPEDLLQPAEQLMTLQPEARELADLRIRGPARPRMPAREEPELLAERAFGLAGRARLPAALRVQPTCSRRKASARSRASCALFAS